MMTRSFLHNTTERDFLTAVGRYRNFEFESQRTPHPEPWMMDQLKTNDVVFDGVTVNPEYEVSIDLNLQKNTNDWWSNKLSVVKQLSVSLLKV